MKHVLDPNLIFYLPLYECDGNTLMSRDARGHLCTVTGSVYGYDGRHFDGSDDKIITDFSSLGDYPFTLAAWIKADTANYVSAFSIGNSTESSRQFYIGQASDSSGKATVWVRNTTPYQIFSANSIIDGSWHFLVGIYHSPVLREMYLDTRYEGNSNNDVGTYESVGVDQLAVGCITRYVHTGFWNGIIGEVFIYNRALTGQEIQQSYLTTKWKYR